MKTFLVLLLALSAAPVAAQVDSARTAPDLTLGSRIRVEYMRGDLAVSTAGRFMELRADTMVLQVGRTQHSVAVADMQLLQYPGESRPRGRWGLFGAGIGAAAGLVLSRIDQEIFGGPVLREEERRPYPSERRLRVVGATALLGAAVGAMLPGVRWHEMPVPEMPAAR